MNKDIENVFRDSFNDLNIKPSVATWTKLNSKLKVKSFLRFSIRTINIYSLFITVGVVSGLSIFGYNISKPELIIQGEHKELVDEKQLVENVVEPKIDIVVNKNIESPSETSALSAAFTASETKGCAPLEVTFINLSTAKKYSWDFGDGETSTLRVPAHIYSESGKYTVSLKITGDDDKSYYHNQAIVVHSAPVALFSINPEKSEFDNKKISFSNDSREAVSYTWIFGDEQSNSEKNAQHIYEKLGTYNITLIAENKHGCTDTVETKVGFLLDNCRLEFPSVFSPSKKVSGEEDELFYANAKGVSEYHLTISNQFGSVVFETKDVTAGWDGYYKGKMVISGNYIWKVNGKFINGKSFQNQGNINVSVKEVEVFDQY